MITLAEILALNMPLDDHGAIADALSQGRTKVVNKEIGDGAISLALGNPAGPLFMLQLEGVANTPVVAEMTPDQIAQIAICRQAWRSINRVGFDVGNQGVRDGIDLMVGSLLTQAQADAIKALAVVADPVSILDVASTIERG